MSDPTNEILTRLGRMEGKQDLILQNQERHEDTLASHGGRLNHVEKHQSRILGYASGVAAAFSFVTTYLFKS